MNGELLRNYLIYTKDVDSITKAFYSISYQLKLWREKGYYIPDISSDTIIGTSDGFAFTKAIKNSGDNSYYDDNMKSLAKVFLGAYLSIDGGFVDYSSFSDGYIKNNFALIGSLLPRNNYIYDYLKSLLENDYYCYYTDFVNKKIIDDKSNNENILKLVNDYNRLYPDNNFQSGFIEIVFYPVIVVMIFTLIYLIKYFF